MLDQIHHGEVIELRLTRKPVNALDPALVAALREAVEQAPANGARGLVLSGAEGIFSAGLDVPTLVQLDRSSMAEFWSNFLGTMRALACSPIPTAAAITGHSPAGGAVLAIWCDYRVMARGEFRIGLNETQVGLAIPAVIVAGLQRLIGAHRGGLLVAEGRLIDPDSALHYGVVDELASPDSVVSQALAWMSEQLAKPAHAYAANRATARRDLQTLFADPQVTDEEGFLAGWFSAPTQAALHTLVAQLKSKH